MRFEWDESKRELNIRKHGFDFADIDMIFENETTTVFDDRFEYGEIRYLTFGLLHGRTVSVTHTENDDVMCVISIRKATKDEETYYFQKIRD